MKGFTLIEILIVMSIIGIIISLGLFISMDAYKASLFSADKDLLITIISFAKAEALANERSLGHGVHIGDAGISLFEGNAYDEFSSSTIIFPRDPEFLRDGLESISFSPLTAIPDSPGEIRLISGQKDFSLFIDSNGSISW